MHNESDKISGLFLELCKQETYQFPDPHGHLNATTNQGVYIIKDSSENVLHVGRTLRAQGGIRQRLHDHLYGRSSFVYHYTPLRRNGAKLRNGYKYQYITVTNDRRRALLEAYATAHLCPAHIGLGNQ
jgi:hypothetical protein